MQSYFILVGLVLMGQVGGSGDGRYGTYENDAQNSKTQIDNGAAQRPSDYPPVTPRREATSQDTAQDLFGTQPQQPADSNPPPASTTKAVASKPSELMRALMTPPLRGQLSGTPVSLSQVVSSSRSRAEQTARVEAYWDLSAAVANYYVAVRAATELDGLRQNVSQPSFMWDEARLALTSRVNVARRTAEAVQFRLQSLLGQSPVGGLPLPSDLPHGGAYQTRYEKNFAGRPSAEAGQLNELLPQLHEDLSSQAAALAADQQWLQTVDRQRSPQSDGTVLLKTYELVILRRLAFISSAFQYNTSIARYAELASPGEVGAERLVAMLIGVRPDTNRPRIDSEVTRTSAEEPVDIQNNLETTPKTFTDEKRAITRREPTPEAGVEHSILVQPSVGESSEQ